MEFWDNYLNKEREKWNITLAIESDLCCKSPRMSFHVIQIYQIIVLSLFALISGEKGETEDNIIVIIIIIIVQHTC